MSFIGFDFCKFRDLGGAPIWKKRIAREVVKFADH